MEDTRKKIIPLQIAILPLIFLVTLLSFNLYANVFIYDADPLAGSSQFILILSGAFAAMIGNLYNVSYKDVVNSISNSIKSVTPALIILLWVGALAGTWMISGIIPSMVYYGLKILDPNIFLPACIIICSIISVATGSSWTTSATVGIALVGIGKALEIPAGMVGGAVIAGAYFGDKLSPLSDTTNLAAAVSKVDLFKHIKYLTYTTIPSISITLIVFIILGINQSSSGVTDNSFLINTIENTFNISLILFIVPIIVLIMIVKKTPPIKALTVGTLLGALFAILFQPQIINELSDSSNSSIIASYKVLIDTITSDVSISTESEILNELFSTGGMIGMLNTIFLVMATMIFGGSMDAIGAIKSISKALLNLADNIFKLFASTVASCLALNLTASDQYLSIVVSGKMFEKAFEDKGLAPENLSRTLEDSATVTSALIPWNSCGAYHSSVLGVSVGEYFIYAIFNWISPFMTLIYAALRIKIRTLGIKNQ
ncbi:Na+/H+ antiporter NhaC [Flavobacteriaceae bacterium]|nr:Na+/H+ antiporter NhaC [Flavobacteriaceae bacterium]